MTVNEIFATIRDWATGKFQPRGDYASTADLSGKLDTDGDSADNTVSFTSEDAADPTGWTDVPVLASGETHRSIFGKISVMVKNIRYLWQLLGSTDISAIGDGTVTGAIDTITSNLDDFMPLSGGELTQGGIISPYGDLYMQSNGYDGWLSHTMDYIKSERNLKTYTALEQIGLTEPSTTAEIYAAMPSNSQALLINSDATDSEVTDAPTDSSGATVLIVKHSAHRGFILAAGKTGKTYIMHLNGIGNPTGTWVKLIEETDLGSADISGIGDGTIKGAISATAGCYYKIEIGSIEDFVAKIENPMRVAMGMINDKNNIFGLNGRWYRFSGAYQNSKDSTEYPYQGNFLICSNDCMYSLFVNGTADNRYFTIKRIAFAT